MRREELFSQSGFYAFLLESNALLHREATRAAIAAWWPVLAGLDDGTPLSVLDLACGGWPVTVADAMAHFAPTRFAYTGIDINPDQVRTAADTFQFPDNVVEMRIIEGNAWDLDDLGLDESFVLVFSGMNLHHGTPEELLHLARQLRTRLAPGGLFFSHDVFRPNEVLYRARPEVIDGDTSWLVNPALIARETVAPISIARDTATADPAWRVDYVDRMRRVLLERGADTEGAESTARHMGTRDFPVSTREFAAIMAAAGLHATCHRYADSTEPMGPYIASCRVMHRV